MSDRFPARVGLHLFLIGIVALAILLTTGAFSGSSAASVAVIPPAPLSGVRAVATTQEELLRPGVSYVTTASPLRSSLPPSRISQLRPTENVDTDETLTGGMVQATSDEDDPLPLSEQIDPTSPFSLYTVREGDTLGGIAERYGTTADNILRNNAEVDGDGWLPIGQQILVPRGVGILYKVGQGETLSAIVDDYLNVTLDEVIAHRPNNLFSGRSIQPGDYILLPNAEPKPPPVYSDNGVILGYYGVPEVSGDRFGLPLPIWGFISDTFGTYRGPGRIHTGVDFALAAYPASSVYAACDGWVSRVEWLTYSYGYYVIVDCGEGWSTLYSHFSEIIVSWGDNVRKGETILGISGSTGFSTGEHLHFEIRYDGAPLDPARYIDF